MKILLVGKETYMYPFYYLIEQWSEKNDLAVFWVNPLESEFDECDLNSSTYYAFQRQGKTKTYTLKDASEKFTAKLDEKIDVEKIKEIEKKYSFYKNINCQIISDQGMTGHYHYRTMNVPVTYEQQLLWIECLYGNIEEILDDFVPDVIYDCDIAELPRTVLNEVAHARGVPYISIAYPKYEMYKIPSYTLSLGIEEYLKAEYVKCLEADNVDEKSYVMEFRNKSSIKNEMYMVKGNTTYDYSGEPLIDTLKSIYGRAVYFWKQDRSKKNKRLKKENPILFVNSMKYMRFWIKTRMYRRKLYKSKDFFEDPVEGEAYVYMPLHLIPESTTFSMAPFWINELTAIELVSKSLPAGWRLYVKEHQAMLGERGEDFYNKVKKIPNVRLVRFNYYNDPKPWMEKAKAVVTITGTAAYEAALLGKPSFVFADVPFSLIKGVTKINCIEDLPELLHDVTEIDNLEEAAAYIKAVKNVGVPINLNYIMNSAYDNLTQGTELQPAFYDEIEKLRYFFERSYERISDKQKEVTR